MQKKIYIPKMQEQSKAGKKNQKSTDKHLSFDGLIQEDIDLSDIYLVVSLKRKLGSYNISLWMYKNANFHMSLPGCWVFCKLKG